MHTRISPGCELGILRSLALHGPPAADTEIDSTASTQHIGLYILIAKAQL